MLKEILIKNFILIDELKLEFNSGFNVFLGETGAGKSIIFKAIDIALGAKTSKDVLKNPEKNALIELTFSDDKEETVISREISKTGTKPRLNGAMVTLDIINEMRQKLVDIHSQHQTYTYLQSKYHIELLDTFIENSDADFKTALSHYKDDYSKFKEVSKKLDIIETGEKENREKIEFLKFQTQEIEQAEIKENEEEELNSELDILSNLENLKELTYGAYYSLNNDDSSIIDALNKIKYNIQKAAEYDNSLSETENSFIDALENLKDISNTLRNYSENLEANPQRLDEINERLELIQKLKRKYGDIFETYEKLKNELDELEQSFTSYEDLKIEKETLLNSITNLSDILDKKRRKYGLKLSSLIENELKSLNLDHAKFDIQIDKIETFGLKGKNKVEFLISTNVSKDLAPLNKTASGGEISRVMLAIKSVFSNLDKVSVIIFDEIDTGISGKTSVCVANAINNLAKSAQVFAITHQPIIASKANDFYFVSKEQTDETVVSVKRLKEDEKPNVLAQMALGDVSDNSLTFAKELLNS